MSKLNAQNERIKRDYLRYLKGARGRSEATLDAVRKALARFEAYTGARDLDHAPLLELIYHLRNGIGHGNKFTFTIVNKKTGKTTKHCQDAVRKAFIRDTDISQANRSGIPTQSSCLFVPILCPGIFANA